jgi:putrescine transport system ATP-binding protein
MDGTVEVDEADHVIIDTVDCKHYVGHGITGTQGMAVTVALRPEKIHVSPEKPEGEFNAVSGVIEELSYFGSFTVYRIKLASGKVLAVSQANTERLREHNLTWGDRVWAHWSNSAHVVLTQ